MGTFEAHSLIVYDAGSDEPICITLYLPGLNLSNQTLQSINIMLQPKTIIRAFNNGANPGIISIHLTAALNKVGYVTNK